MLFIVATPIGNLKDISLRALETLQACDAVICEDSRHTGLLLNHFNIKKPLITLNDFNEFKMVPNIIAQIREGKNLALVSDAGTPLVSDPGYKLVRECLASGFEVDSIPGASAVLDALVLSGLPPDKFFFLGYLPEKQGKRVGLLKNLNAVYSILNTTYIIYVAPHKLVRTLEDMEEALGDIEVTLAHELTKLHQEIASKKISDWLPELKNPKGEYVLLFRPATGSA